MTEAERHTPAQLSFKPVRGWQTSRAWGICLVVTYLVAVCLPVVLALLSGGFGMMPMREVGLVAGLLGFSLLAMQPVLAGRFHWLDRPFGLDMVMRFHTAMAILAVVLLLVHPVLLTLTAGPVAGGTPWPVWVGIIAVLLLLAGGVYALLARLRFRVLEYQTWRRLHKGMIAVVVLGFIHSILLGRNLRDPVLRTYWSALFATAVVVFLWRNVFVPLAGRRRFRVTDVRQSSHDSYTISMEPADGKDLPPRNPGQFMFLKLIRPGRTSEEHPFTISASPTEPGRLTATIKESGDFTNTIGSTRPDDRALAEHPFGRFSYVHHDVRSFVFIAGGVGITPIRSMLMCLADCGDTRPAVLIYGNKKERDILFRDELAELPENVRITHVLSEPDEGWQGETGFVTSEIIQRHAGESLAEADVFLCGPPAMMRKVRSALKDLGVDSSRIHYERFSM